ncbi:MAG: hypothetical protein Q9217_005697 [Psora testacea]
MFVGFPLRLQFRRTFPIAKRFFRPTKSMSSASLSHLERLYHWQEEVENLEAYCSGGYHPIELGDEFCQGRYRIVHKLGYGSFSTVWLARDSTADRYVSLKVIAANASERSSEAEVLNSIHHNTLHHLGRRFILSLLDEFLVSGPNGKHRCLVSEALGPTVLDVKESFNCDLLPLNIARRVTVQLALGLADIHSCGIVHGDIHIKNIAFKPPNLDSWSVEQVYEHVGSPNKQVITRNDGNPLGPEAPPYVVSPAILLKLGKPPTNEISILDFGEASFTTELRKQWHTPILLQAPEALLGEPVGQPADIWAFACTVFAMFDNKSLFEGFMPNADDVLSEIVDTLGRLPERWWEKWEQRGEFYEEDGRKKIEHLTEQYREIYPLAVRMRRMRSRPSAAREAEQLSEEDSVGLRKLLEKCLRYEPEERATAEEILKMDWIQQLRGSV